MNTLNRRVRLAVIVLIVSLPAAIFAFAAGWLSPARLSPEQFVEQLESNAGVHAGYRRNHAKGICVSGYFSASEEARQFSRAEVFTPGRHPVNGRLSIPGGNPYGSDGKTPLRSMGLKIDEGSDHEWRMAMNSSPVFVVASTDAFYALLQAAEPDTISGKPDPERMAAFFASHPESVPFRQWASHHTPADSFAASRFNSINSFVFTDKNRERRYVRWSFIPAAVSATTSTTTPAATSAQLASAAEAVDDTDKNNFLFTDLVSRLQQAPLQWNLQLQIAGAGDPVNDATKVWPPERQLIHAGTLVIVRSEPQDSGACRDVNFDPLILPGGIAASEDPLLPARSAVYSGSFTRRITEQANLEAKP